MRSTLVDNYFTLLAPKDVSDFTVRCPECGYEAEVINVEFDDVITFPLHHTKDKVVCDFAYWPMRLVREHRQERIV